MFNFNLALPAILGTLLVCAIGGLLSPIVVLKQRSYLTDTLAHLIFPGVVIGLMVAQIFHWEVWVCLLIGAATTAFLGTYISEWFLKILKVPPDSSAIVMLTTFFAFAVLLMSIDPRFQIDPESLLFGDALNLKWRDVLLLFSVFASISLIIFFYRNHWNAWLTDPEFAQIAGFNVRLLDKIFPALITIAVLTGLLAVGGLMISAIITLPALVCQPRSAISPSTVIFSLVLGVCGTVISLALSLPIGPVLVIFGFVCLFGRCVYVRQSV